MKVYIGGCRGVSLVSMGIKLETWSPYSHVLLMRDDQMTIEAWHFGGVQKNLDPMTLHSPDTQIDLFEILYPEPLHHLIWENAEAKVGCEYDFRALLGFIPPLRWLWKNDPNRWFCSHTIADDCCIDEQYQLFNDTVPLYKIDPGFLLSSPYLKRI